MEIYHYNCNTGEYLGSSYAEADPAETLKRGIFVPLMPAYATAIKPPECKEKNKAVAFRDGKWVIVEDYRDTHVIFREDFTFEAISDLGEPDALMVTKETADDITNNPNDYIYDGVEIRRKTTAERLKDRKVEKIEENEKIRNEFISKGVSYKGYVFDNDTEQKLNLKYQLETMSSSETVEWYSQDGVSALTCTKKDIQNLLVKIQEVNAYVWQVRNPEIKHKINTAKTIKDLNNIEISYELQEIEK